MKQKILVILTLLILSLFLTQTTIAQTTISSVKSIEISPTQTIETKTCPVNCICEGDLVTCPVETSCTPPCIKSGNTCTCPAEKGTCTSHIDDNGCTIIECSDGTSTKTCPVTDCKSPCIKSGNTCTCPAEKTWTGTLQKCIVPASPEAWECGKCYNYFLILENGEEITFNDKSFTNLNEFVGKRVKIIGYKNNVVLIMCPIRITATNIELAGEVVTCPVNCICEGDVTTCPAEKQVETCPEGCTCSGDTVTCQTTETRPVEAKIETVSGVETISISKIEDKLSITTKEASAITTEKLIIEKSKLYLKTSAGNKEVKILPEEASSKATEISKISEIELIEESQKPVYSVKGTKQARILFIFPVEMEIGTKVNAETGNIISISKPWWSFLAW